jgi:hypothetical protein
LEGELVQGLDGAQGSGIGTNHQSDRTPILMRITGKGIWGKPADLDEAVRSYVGLSNWESTLLTQQIPTGRAAVKKS